MIGSSAIVMALSLVATIWFEESAADEDEEVEEDAIETSPEGASFLISEEPDSAEEEEAEDEFTATATAGGAINVG